MSDIVEGGARPPWPRWVRLVVTVVALVGLASYLIVRANHDGTGWDAAGEAATRSPTPEPAADSPTPTPPTWPTTPGACGSEAPRPLFAAAALGQRTGLQLLVGGAQLSTVDVDSGRTTVLASAPARSQVDAITHAGAQTYALISTCTGRETPSRLVRVVGDRVRTMHPSGPVTSLISGPGGAWGVDYSTDPSRAVLRPLRGGADAAATDTVATATGRATRLPAGVVPFAVTRKWIVGVRYSGPDDSISTVTLTPLEPGSRTRALGRGWPLAVGTDDIVWVDAGAALSRRLHRSGPSGRVERSYALPPDRGVADGVLDPTGRLLAFRLSRAAPDRRYASGHTAPPGDIAVLDLETGRRQSVPDLELAPKTGADLAFSPDSRWLLITVSEGSHGELLMWRTGGSVLQRAPTRLAGALAWAPPLLVLPGHDKP